MFSFNVACRNVTPDPITSYRLVAPDPNILLIYHLLSPLFTSLTIFHQAFFIQGITLIEKVQDYKFHVSGFQINHKQHIDCPNHTTKYIKKFTISLNDYQSLLRVYLSHRINPNLPPPRNRSRAS
uniref:Putative ovule protein n=1 Tax=Solanum chacoense TaxID=4108 RepID=A0A0V0HHW1_SOLCH